MFRREFGCKLRARSQGPRTMQLKEHTLSIKSEPSCELCSRSASYTPPVFKLQLMDLCPISRKKSCGFSLVPGDFLCVANFSRIETKLSSNLSVGRPPPERANYPTDIHILAGKISETAT